jgi:hypothetical protein
MELRLLKQRESIAQNVDDTNNDDRMLEIYDMKVRVLKSLLVLLQAPRRCQSMAVPSHPDFFLFGHVQGLGLKHFHRKGLKMLSNSLSLAQANYPEDLCQTYIINAPRVFNMVWKVRGRHAVCRPYCAAMHSKRILTR